VTAKQAKLTWDWGDGTTQVFPAAGHHVDTRPTHVYRAPGTYKLRLIAELSGAEDVATAWIEVGPVRPAVAVFAPLADERWVTASEQAEIVAALSAALAAETSAVRHFAIGQGELLADWMESLLDDSVADVLVLLDFVPAATVAGGIPGSLLARWVERGNGLVWSGTTPLLTTLDDDGFASIGLSPAETFFGVSGSTLVLGTGQQAPTALGTSLLPSLASFRSQRALRYDQIRPPWSVARIFAEDADQDSDALELVHSLRRGFYAQFHCEEQNLPRRAVLTEYLRGKVTNAKLGASGAQRR
jgi:PKD repeat protein